MSRPWAKAGLTTMQSRPRLWAAVVLGAVVGAFVLDLSLPAGYAGAMLCSGIVILAVLGDRVWLVVATAAAGAALTTTAFMIKGPTELAVATGTVWFNRLSSVGVIVLAGFAGVILVRRGRGLRELSQKLTVANTKLERQSRMVTAARELGRIGGWSVDLETGAVGWSDEIAQIHGFTPGTTPSWTEVVNHYVPEDRARLRELFERCAVDGTPFIEQSRMIGPDGEDVWILCFAEAVRSDTGEIVSIQGAKQDITAWRVAEGTATSQFHRFEQLTRSLPFGVWTATPDGLVDYINPALAEYSGKPESELVSTGWIWIVHPYDQQLAYDRWAEARESCEHYDNRLRFQRADGAYRWHHVQASPELDGSGQVVRWWGTAIDIEDFVALHEQADAIAEDRERILQSVGDAVCNLDSSWRVTYVNDNAEVLMRLPREQVLGEVLWDVFPPVVGTEIEATLRRAIAKGEVQRVTDFYAPHDTWLDITATPSAEGLTVTFRDVSEFRSLTEQLQQAQRLESVGRLTGGIAHDFNNLLTVVIGGTAALQSDEPNLSEAGKELLDLIHRAANRGAELTHHLLAFARRQPLAPQAIDTSAMIRDLVPLLRRTIGDGVSVRAELGADLPPAHVDPAQLESAILNLCINARDAMPHGGILAIETAVADLDEASATAHGEVAAGNYVVLSVSDSGTGIPPEHIPRLFDPFFTTKAAGEGSGLGLPMVWGFVKQSGGHISVYSEVGEGTTLRLYLPLAPEGSDQALETPLVDDEDFAGEGVVLLAEDDLLVQQFAAQQLRQRGYQVIVANSGPEALEVLDTIDRLDLLFTDLIMPGGMTGRQLAEQVQLLRPGTPVLFCSGYAEDIISHDGRLDADVALLTKPYSSQQLAASVLACMMGARQAK
jgi:PAS domain S-box-containing protein